MNENKQKNPEGKPSASYGAGKKLHPDVLKWIIIGLAGFAVVVLIFGAGMFVGGLKTKFSYRWAEQYHKNFAGPTKGFFSDWRRLPLFPGDFIEAHGVFGQIIKIDNSALVIRGRDDLEKIVLVKDDTVIKGLRETLKITDLKVDDFIIVIGEPNEAGQIEAKLIRIFPAPSAKTSFRSLPSRRSWQ